MIISASRRTDIPAFYTPWLMNRLRAGFCTVPNPFNPQQVARISLKPADVDALLLVSRNPHPLLQHLDELDRMGYNYYFQYTLIGNPRLIDPHTPPAEAGVRIFREFASHVGPQRMVWRYDPVVLSDITPPAFHVENFRKIAQALAGSTELCIFSIMDLYSKARGRLAEMSRSGARLLQPYRPENLLETFVPAIVNAAAEVGITIQSCAEELDLERYGVQSGACIDAAYIQKTFGVSVGSVKDPFMRKACNCARSRDVGMYDGCLFGCPYCYATSSFERAWQNYRTHDPLSPSLFGWFEAPEDPQLSLFS